MKYQVIAALIVANLGWAGLADAAPKRSDTWKSRGKALSQDRVIQKNAHVIGRPYIFFQKVNDPHMKNRKAGNWVLRQGTKVQLPYDYSQFTRGTTRKSGSGKAGSRTTRYDQHPQSRAPSVTAPIRPVYSAPRSRFRED